MKCKITSKDSAVFFNNVFYDCNKDLEMSFSDAYRLKRIFPSVTMELSQVKYDDKLWKDEKYFGFTSDVDLTSGWGNVTFNLLKNSKHLNPSLVGRMNQVHDIDITTIAQREVKREGVMVWHEQPKEAWLNSPFAKNIAIVPFETTRVPQSWVAKINNMDALFTCCKQNIQMFRDSGVRIPIELIRWGYDPKKFYPLERNNEVFTFGHMGALSKRKGTDTLISAFEKAFTNGENVKLICKTSNTFYPFMSKDNRIEVQMGLVSHDELMKDFFQKIDCFVFPTRGEGFGLPALEALATGIPTIATGWSGIVEFLNDKVGWLLNYKMVPAEEFSKNVYKEDCGEWAEPDEQHLIQILRYCYEHQDKVKQKGMESSKYALENWTWDNKIKEFHEALNKTLQ